MVGSQNKKAPSHNNLELNWCNHPESNRDDQWSRDFKSLASTYSAMVARILLKRVGGSGEIRTHGWVTPSSVFKTGPFNHSGTLPLAGYYAKLASVLTPYTLRVRLAIPLKEKNYNPVFLFCHLLRIKVNLSHNSFIH